jgi:uncharacterized protein (TIGR03067 family)
MRTHANLVLTGLAILLAGSVQGGDAKKAEAALQGTWTGSHEDKKVEVKFDGGKFVVKLGDAVYKGTFKVDAAKKPGHIDMSVKEGEKYVGMVALGIYKLEGAKLTWRTSEPGREQRPEDFTSPVEGTMLLVLERGKKE